MVNTYIVSIYIKYIVFFLNRHVKISALCKNSQVESKRSENRDGGGIEKN